MSAICNKQAGLTDEMMREKTPLARRASARVLGATSDFYKALERMEYNPTEDAVVPYLQSGAISLEMAEVELRRVRDINASNPSPQEYSAFVAWARDLDFQRLYVQGTSLGLIPPHMAQWKRLAGIQQNEGPIGLLDHLLTDLGSIRARATQLIEIMQSQPGTPTITEVSTKLLALYTAIIELSAFGRMISYMNAVEPMDPQWSRTPVSAVQGGRA